MPKAKPSPYPSPLKGEGTNSAQGLNPEQLSAVTHSKGPLLIVAGAGTGKTTVITERLAWLIMEKNVKPDEILALTFTNKAAREMEERVDKLLPYGYVDLWVSTFHTFCQRILQSHCLDIGLSTEVELLEDTGQWLLVRQNLARFDLDYYRPGGNPTKFIQALLTHFSRLKDEEISPEDYLKYAEGLRLSLDDMEASGGKSSRKLKNTHLAPHPNPLPKGEGAKDEIKRIVEVANAYHTYQQLLLEKSKMDFGDLINYCLKLFRTRPQILKEYQKKFKYILVDEFQDTNWAQYELIKMLAAPENNLTVVADDDQSIYRFRGASTSNVIMFSREYKDAKKVSLVRNYRSGQQILDAAHAFIELNNPDRLEADPALHINKKLVSATNRPAQIEHLHCQTSGDEARVVAETILELKKHDKEASWNDFAILVRANNQAEIFEDTLAVMSIPRQNLSAKGLYRAGLILDIMAFLRVLDDYHESAALYRLLNAPFIAVPIEDIVRLTHHSSRKQVALFSLLKNPQQVAGISKEAVLEIARLVGQLELFAAKTKTDKPSVILVEWLEQSGYFTHINHLPDAIGAEQYRMLKAFFERVKQIETSIPGARVKDIVETLRLEIESGEKGDMPLDTESGPEMVKVMTIHSAKGLEFKYVFIVNLVDKRFPTIERSEPIAVPDELIKEVLPVGDVHLQEERRLFYVGLTRAKEGLFLTSAEDYGGVTTKRLSRFLHELAETYPVFKLTDKPLKADELAWLPKISSPAGSAYKLPVPTRFSFTQLRAFESCPLQYKFAHVLKVPIQGKYVFSYGQTMHTTLQEFFQILEQKKRAVQVDLFGNHGQSNPVIASEAKQSYNRDEEGLSDGGLQRVDKIASVAPQDAGLSRNDMAVSLDELLSIYERNWIDDWYDSPEQKEEYRKKGRAALRLFYEKLQTAAPTVQGLEQGFNIRVGDFTLMGKIDRIDILPSSEIEIVDYKTGASRLKLEAEDKEQLLIYQIAAEEVFNEKVKNLTYYYLDDGKEMSFLGTDIEKNDLKVKIVETIEKIKGSSFAPTPGPFVCKFCDFRDICEFRKG